MMKRLAFALLLLGGVFEVGHAQSAPAFVDVRSYGAVCDQVADDTVAIQAAVNAAGATATNQLASSVLVISGQCKISGPITIRNQGGHGHDSPFRIMCTGGGAGLFWNGAENGGPMLIVGDVTNQALDNGIDLSGCTLAQWLGTWPKPSSAIEIHNSGNVHIRDSWIGYVHNGIKCVNSCLVFTLENLFFSACFLDCIFTDSGVGWKIDRSTFNVCGQYCIDGNALHTSTISNNYFEGNVGSNWSDVGGSKGSVYLWGDGDRLIGNTFEDANTAAGVNFRSVTWAPSGSNHVSAFNWYGANATYPGGPAYAVAVLGATSVDFIGEMNLAPFPTAIDQESSAYATKFVGGQNCDPNRLFGGSNANAPMTIGACNGASRGWNGSSSLDNAGHLLAFTLLSSQHFPDVSGSCVGGVGPEIGNELAGQFTTSAACNGGTIIFNFRDAAPHGWNCATSPQLVQQYASNAPSTTTFVGNWPGANQSVNYQCVGY